MPDIIRAVRTRQTMQLVLKHFEEEIDTLHATAQISEVTPCSRSLVHASVRAWARAASFDATGQRREPIL